MELQLQELLDRIKREGVEAGRAEAERVLAEAESARKALLEGAEREAKAIVDKARSDASKAQDAGTAALAQASRDVLLAFQDRLRALLDSVVHAETTAAYGPEVTAEALPAVLKALAAGGAEDLAVLLPPAALAKIQSRFASRLAAELQAGIELRPDPGVDAGFRVSEKGGAAYYDFSARAVAELLSRHLNARLAEIVKGAAQGL
jgi:V/A-type H+/Na+-transporting ATPase subunit E